MKNALSIIAITLSALSAATVANAATADFSAPELTRAQVRAELAAARAAGAIQQGDETLIPVSMSTRPRTEVKAELAAAVAAGTIQRGDATYVPPSVSTLSRAVVQADLAAWNQAGLSAEWRGQQTPDIDSKTYRVKRIAYERALSSSMNEHVASVL